MGIESLLVLGKDSTFTASTHRVSRCSCPGAHYVSQVDLKIIEICLPPPLKC